MMIIFTLLLGALLSVIGVISMPWVAKFLGATEEMMADCVIYGRIVTGFTVAFMLQNVFQSFLIAAEKPKLGLLATVLAGFNIFTSSFFTALNNGAVSAAISFMRTLIFQTSSVLILPMFLGVDGIWWAITVAEFFAFILSLIFLFAKRKKYNYI